MHFEQSNEWARFQRAVGRRVFILSPSKFIEFEQDLTRADGEGVAVERVAMRGLRYLEVNGWAVLSDGAENTVQALMDAGRNVGAIFVRWTPSREVSSLKDLRAVAPKVLVHQIPPKATLVLDLKKTEEELLSAMHEKTRYNIRLAERKGVEVRHASIDEGFEAFWNLMQETAARDKIGVHPRVYYRKMLEMMGDRGKDSPPSKGENREDPGGLPTRRCQARLFFAEYNNIPLATAILIIYGDTATYLHGASSNANRNLMAPHLLQWRMMQYAKQQGMKQYDFWGIQPKGPGFRVQDSGSHSWAGITRFKMGFGGEVWESAGTFDVICRPFVYNVLSLGRMLKRAL